MYALLGMRGSIDTASRKPVRLRQSVPPVTILQRGYTLAEDRNGVKDYFPIINQGIFTPL
jgi:hypothetical protein